MNEKDKTLTALRQALLNLQQRWPICSLALFGSVARGEAGPASDLDGVRTPIGLSSFVALEQELTALTGRRADLVSRLALSADSWRGAAGLMAKRDYCDFLNDIVEACQSIIRFAGGMTLETYLADEKTRYAVMRG
jgi:uncharacterized protein